LSTNFRDIIQGSHIDFFIELESYENLVSEPSKLYGTYIVASYGRKICFQEEK